MKPNNLLRHTRGVLVLLFLAGSRSALAQGPTLDPTFQTNGVYKPASVSQVLQQPDGKLLVLSGSLRAGNQPAGQVARLLANSNEPDSIFTSNARRVQGAVRYMVLLPSGKVLLSGYGNLTLGSVVRQQLLLLNADGTPDAGFNANAAVGAVFGSAAITNVVGQPDGKLVAVFSNPSVIGGGKVVRLLPDGTLDTAFQTALAASMPVMEQVGTNAVVQPDGKLLVPGSFAGKGVMRLLPTGALDPAFTAQLPTAAAQLVNQIALQPDGKLVITRSSRSSSLPSVVRLTDTGAIDPTFQSALTSYASTGYPIVQQVQVQSDGKLLVYGSLTGPAISLGTSLVRLLPSGALDTSFDITPAVGPVALADTRLLPNGQVLAVKPVKVSQGEIISRLVLLNANGSLDPTLEPRLYTNGKVNDVVQLPTGGYLIGGDFTEFNGVSVKYLARLSSAGVPDPAFAVAADNEVRTLLVQPDGKLVIGGAFERIAGGNRVSLARLLPTGALDTGFAPAFFPTTFSLNGGIERVGLLPDGRVVAAGGTRTSSTSTVKNWLRILDATTGQPDLTLPVYQASDLLIQPNGKIVVAGFDTISTGSPFRGACIFRLLPSGALDPAFTPLPGSQTGIGGGPVITALAQSATGEIVATGRFYIDAGASAPSRLYSFQADGQPIASLADSRFTNVKALAIQPNGRLLAGNDMNNITAAYGLSRLLNTLAADPSFAGTNRPAPATVNRIVVQADGAIMVAGSFTAVGGQPAGGLVRLLDANVLSVSNQQLAALTQAWPVPAHGQLHLRLDAASRPQRVELLDALGRVVLTQNITQSDLTLDTSPLRAGAYALRVQYASGPVSRRVVVE